MEFGSTFLSNLLAPSSLFVLLNLMIGTIFLTARLGARRTQRSDSAGQLARARSSSFSLLDRVRSINLSLHSTDDPARLARPPSLLDRLRSLGSDKSDPEPEREPSLKTASKIEDNGGEREGREITEDKRRPETARLTENKTARATTENETASSRGVREECVDAKADDFINRFRQQLRLQRLESLKRLSEMIKGK